VAPLAQTFMLFAYPTGVQGNVVSPGVNEFVIPNYKQTWGAIRKIAVAPESVKHLTFKSEICHPLKGAGSNNSKHAERALAPTTCVRWGAPS
jgi:hypothetical protein